VGQERISIFMGLSAFQIARNANTWYFDWYLALHAVPKQFLEQRNSCELKAKYQVPITSDQLLAINQR
jgi:hypothetical protein